MIDRALNAAPNYAAAELSPPCFYLAVQMTTSVRLWLPLGRQRLHSGILSKSATGVPSRFPQLRLSMFSRHGRRRGYKFNLESRKEIMIQLFSKGLLIGSSQNP